MTLTEEAVRSEPPGGAIIPPEPTESDFSLQAVSKQDVLVAAVPPSVVVAVREVPESTAFNVPESAQPYQPEQSSTDPHTVDTTVFESTHESVQEVEVPPEPTRSMPSVPEPNTPATRRTQASRPTTPQSSAIPLSATTQGRSAPPPIPAQVAANRASAKGPFTPAPLAPNQDPHIPLPMPSLPVVLLLPIPITLAYLRVSFLGMLLGLLVSWYIWAEWKRKKIKRTDFGPEVDRDRVKGLNPRWEHERYNEESVGWMNHALRALFPLINTDILTPFIDLVEDALLTQVPPIVVSPGISVERLINRSARELI